MTTQTDRVLAALNIAIADTDSSVVRELLRKARRELDGKVLVPREVIEGVRETLKAFTTFSPNASKRQVAKEALSMLQPYTKGE